MKIFAAILLLLLLFLSLPLRIRVSAGEDIFVGLRYLWVKKQLFPKPSKKEAPVSQTAETPQKPKKEKAKTKLSQSPKELFELAILLLGGIKKPVRKLLKRTSIAGISVSLVIGGQDAHKTALLFGNVNTAVYNALCALDRIFTLRVKRIDIRPDFCGENFKYDCEAELRVFPIAVLAAAVSLLPLAIRLILTLLRSGKKNKKEATGGADKAACKPKAA